MPSKLDRWLYRQADRFGTPILKVINRALIAINKRLMEHNAKRGDDA